MALPGDKFIDNANTTEKLDVLIAHHIKHLGPKHQANYQDGNHKQPPKLSHSTLRINILCKQVTIGLLNRS